MLGMCVFCVTVYSAVLQSSDGAEKNGNCGEL